MGIARRATSRLIGLSISMATACGCGNKPPAVPRAPEPQQASPSDQRLPPPPTSPRGEMAAPGESAEAQKELARSAASLEASQAQALKLQQELKAAQANLRGWHAAYKAAQAQTAALQKTAAALKARNEDLQRQHANAAAALRDAQGRLALQSQSVPQAPASEPPGAAVIPPEASLPSPAPVASSALGVLRDVRPFRGRPYATLSIGHDAGVRRGMRLGLLDPRTGAPAGVVTVDEVGPADSGGVVEAADPLGVRPGLTVHSLADVAR